MNNNNNFNSLLFWLFFSMGIKIQQKVLKSNNTTDCLTKYSIREEFPLMAM